MYLDGTGRVITTGQPVIFLGVIDQGQSYHNVVAGIFDSENAPQCSKVVATTFEHANMIRAREDENEGRATPREPLSLNWACSDNSDALQKSVEDKDGVPVNCKVHVMRNAKDAEGIVAAGGLSRKEVVKEVQADISRLSQNTFHAGVSVDDRPIADELLVLFVEKWENKNQQRYATKIRSEYMGQRKGKWQAAYTNPGIPVHNNGVEKFNDSFKEEGTRSSNRASVLC